MTSEVYLVLLVFGQTRERQALDLLIPTLRRALPGGALRTVVVDNALAGESQRAIDEYTDRISGDNTLREFSGWDRGLAWLDQRYAPRPDAIVVLANDTVARPDKFERVRSLPPDRVVAASHGALVGWVDEYPRPVRLFGMELRQWVDTSLVVAERRTLATLEPFAVSPPDQEVFDQDWRQVFREPSPLSDNYRAYLKTYFCGERLDVEFEHGWYALAPLAAETFDAFKIKVRCVFCEHLFSARARARGIPLVDIRPTPLPIDPVAAAGGESRV